MGVTGYSGTTSGEKAVWVIWRALQGTKTVIVRPIEYWIFPPTKHSLPPLAMCLRTGAHECWQHAGDVEYYTAVDEPWKPDREAQGGSRLQSLHHLKNREGSVLFCTHRLSHHGLFYGLKRRGTAGKKLTYYERGEILSGTSSQVSEYFQAPGILGVNGAGTCATCSRWYRMNALYTGRKMLGVKAVNPGFR